MKKFNHALTIAYEVESDDEKMPTYEEALSGLLKRVANLLADRNEAEEALLSEYPFDTYDQTTGE